MSFLSFPGRQAIKGLNTAKESYGKITILPCFPLLFHPRLPAYLIAAALSQNQSKRSIEDIEALQSLQAHNVRINARGTQCVGPISVFPL